ncbi:MAG: ergothioneine biosynthesis protein EgtB [Pseudomonadota bacterium]
MAGRTSVRGQDAPNDGERSALAHRFAVIRKRSEQLARHLTPEDMVLQAMPDASPVRWHLAHTTWFFEEFILGPFSENYEAHHPQYRYLFNSYYEAVGERWPRMNRGLLSRPSPAEILLYREDITERVLRLIHSISDDCWAEMAELLTVGCHHEEQHQELLCTDIKAAFGLNPIFPEAFPLGEHGWREDGETVAAANERWIAYEGGLTEIGAHEQGFAFDNETPRHRVWLEDYELHGTPVTAGQFLDFMDDGGYRNPSLWLSDGWDWLQSEGVDCPLYWHFIDGDWFEFTLHGLVPLRRDRILTHISAYEAFAFASWAQARLPYEAELERALVGEDPNDAQWLDPDGIIHPRLAGRDQRLGSAYGSVWDWTQSAYSAYPGYRPMEGALGEYNGKFMSSQLVLKGGSCATPPGHIRASYRNFFPPHARWQFTGIRLARGTD